MQIQTPDKPYRCAKRMSLVYDVRACFVNFVNVIVGASCRFDVVITCGRDITGTALTLVRAFFDFFAFFLSPAIMSSNAAWLPRTDTFRLLLGFPFCSWLRKERPVKAEILTGEQ